MDQDTLEQLAERAAQDGEHAVLASLQALLRGDGDADDRRIAREFMEEIGG